MKICNFCGVEYPLTNEFFPISKGKLEKNCKNCKKNLAREYYLANKDRVLENNRKYKEKNCEAVKAIKKEYYNNNKDQDNERRRRQRLENRERERETSKKYREDNKDKTKEASRKYRETNRDVIAEKKRIWQKSEAYIEYQKNYHEQNKETLREQNKEYYQNNKEKLIEKQRWYLHSEKGRIVDRAHKHKRKSLLKEIPNTLTSSQVEYKLVAQNFRCYYGACGFSEFECKDGMYMYHLEHTIPLSRTEHNPRNDMDYVVLACPSCNLSKGAKLPHEWKGSGRLF